MIEDSKNNKNQSITSKLSHSGAEPSRFSGLVNPPVHRASTIIFDTYNDFKACFDAPYRYGREATPTSDAFTNAIADLDGAFGAIATPSGLSAINASVMAFVAQSDHILVPDNIYGFARVFFDDTLAKMGVITQYYDPMEPIETLRKRITPQTKLIYLEAPGSITYEVPNLQAIITCAKEHDLMTIIDNSWATPINLRPLSLGIDIAIMSATKYINGHSDIMLGVCSCRNEETFTQLRHFTRQMGICAGSEELYLGLRGLRTLDVRLRQHAKNGMRLASWLQDHPAVKEVRHPALPSCPGHQYWQENFDGYSGVFAVILKETQADKISACLNRFKLFKMGFSWGGYESLIFPEQPTAARSVNPWDPDAGFILRIHAGLEDIDELHADIEQALATLI